MWKSDIGMSGAGHRPKEMRAQPTIAPALEVTADILNVLPWPRCGKGAMPSLPQDRPIKSLKISPADF